MADSIIYVSFKDTASDKNIDSQKLAVDSLSKQILAAAERIQQNKDAIYDYIRQDTVMLPPGEASQAIPTSIPIFKTSSAPMPKMNVEQDMIEKAMKCFNVRTESTKKTVTYFVQNSGIQLKIQDIANAVGSPAGTLSVWLGGTGKQCKAITCVSRGVYLFNPDLL
jgi:hypothetical protein